VLAKAGISVLNRFGPLGTIETLKSPWIAVPVEVIRAMWSDERSVRVEGAHYRIAGVHPGPRPGGGLGIWLGAYGPRMLALTGAAADGWLPSHAFLGLDALPDAIRRTQPFSWKRVQIAAPAAPARCGRRSVQSMQMRVIGLRPRPSASTSMPRALSSQSPPSAVSVQPLS